MKPISRTTAILIASMLAGFVTFQPPGAVAATAHQDAGTGLIAISADPTAGEARTRTYSRADLRSFVIAAVQIDRAARRHAQARPADDAGSQAASARAHIRSIIEATPRLDLERYRAIAEALRTDPVLRSRVRRVIQDLRWQKHDALRPLTADTL